MTLVLVFSLLIINKLLIYKILIKSEREIFLEKPGTHCI